ncbi:Deubiquitinating enzyme domain-containing protein [Phytophthora infestans]|uniref:Deubiquitinating enzyme domain-containing protein n=1 Tax=Phytophthora infestans TaxID=4787 RepID=A0A8S9TY58_PHYIN|nr:Deubiquitinating enzyme domain-containing protein [Phytophthora infestans]
MLDKQSPRRRASQPLLATSRSTQGSLPRPSSFLLTGLKSWTKRTKNERWKGRRDSNTNSTRRVSADSDEDIDENVIEILSIPTNGDYNSGDDTDDAEMSSGKTSLPWKRLVPKASVEAGNATVMYSISFYPWKMEPHCYYSHPEAAANWVPDTASSRCQICLISFTLTRRRHHCRLCGHLVCANCSNDRTYLPFAGSAPSQHGLIKDGAPQRTCRACASTLRNMAGQDDPRVKRFTVAVCSARRRKPTAPISGRSVVEVEVERPSPWLKRTGLALTDSEIEDEEFFVESTKGLQLEQRSRGSTHHYPLRLSVTRAEELDEVLSARTCSRLKATVNHESRSRRFVISSAWLDQWLQYVRVDSATDAAGSSLQLPGQRQCKRYRMDRPPRPGPVANYILLDFVNGELVSKHSLQRSRGSLRGGDYHVVSQEVWMTFLKLYGGGPSIQVPSNEPLASGNLTRSPARRQWIVTELDDSIPALASSSGVENFSTATRMGASSRNRKEVKALHHRSTDTLPRTRSTPPNRLISASSMPSVLKKTSSHFSLHSEASLSSSSTRFKLWEEEFSRANAETMVSDRTSEGVTATQRSSERESDDTSSTLAAVSAFASAATLARQRSAVSLSKHPAAISGRTNGQEID